MKQLMTLAALCCLLMTSCGDDEPTRLTYESVDLGLSVKWATTNVGAINPEDNGRLFGWADSTGSHKTFDQITIAYRPGSDGHEVTVVNWNSIYYGGKNPLLNISGTPYDIAIYQWNSKWRMPTKSEWQELMERCTWTTETTENGLTVYRVTGPNGNHIILPMTGMRAQSGNIIEGRTTKGCYWTSESLPLGSQAAYYYESNVPCAAWCVQFRTDSQPMLTTDIRCYGMAIRPVAAN